MMTDIEKLAKALEATEFGYKLIESKKYGFINIICGYKHSFKCFNEARVIAYDLRIKASITSLSLVKSYDEKEVKLVNGGIKIWI